MKIPFPKLRTERLILNRFELSDAPDVQRMAGDRIVAENTLNMPHPYLDGMAEQWIELQEIDFMDRKSIIFAIRQKNNNRLIGAIGLTMQLKYRVSELGYWIGAEYWNRGFCTEAVKAVLKFAFEELKLHKVYANFFSSNTASGRVMEKAGMHYEGVLKSHLWHWDSYKDLIYYSIFNPEHKVDV